MTTLVFLEQAAGFLLQTLPIAFLCFVPFEDQDMRIPMKKLYPCVAAGLLLLSLGFASLSYLLYDPTGSHDQLILTGSNLYMSVCLLLGASLFFLNVRVAPAKKALILTMLIHYEAMLCTLVSVTMGEFTSNVSSAPDEGMIMYGPLNLSIHTTLILLTLLPVLLFLKWIVRDCLKAMENRMLRRGFLYLLFSLLLYCICFFSLTNWSFYYGIYGHPVLLLLAAFILTDVLMYCLFFAEVRLSIQNRQLADQLHSFDLQYLEIQTGIDEARRARHDVRHHLNILSELNREGKTKELTAYLQQYEASCENLEKIRYCGYPTLDNLLSYYIELAKKEHIDVTADILRFRKSPAFAVIDMTVLIGNLMENAIQACRSATDHEKKIHIMASLKENVFLLSVENSCASDIPDTTGFTDGACFVSPLRAPFHGQGLKSIRHVADKYGGSAEFQKKNTVFTARIVLNAPVA